MPETIVASIPEEADIILGKEWRYDALEKFKVGNLFNLIENIRNDIDQRKTTHINGKSIYMRKGFRSSRVIQAILNNYTDLQVVNLVVKML